MREQRGGVRMYITVEVLFAFCALIIDLLTLVTHQGDHVVVCKFIGGNILDLVHAFILLSVVAFILQEIGRPVK